MTENPALTMGERVALLRHVREALAAWLERRHLMDQVEPDMPAGLLAPRGTFVTLHRQGRLRGCIGTFQADEPLVINAVRMGVAAAVQDPRFPPLRAEELDECEIEVSVLSPTRPVASPAEIEVGRHGVQLTLGPHRGVFLPQVAPEQGWDRDALLDHLCEKAGLHRGAWRTRPVRLDVFTAEVVSE